MTHISRFAETVDSVISTLEFAGLFVVDGIDDNNSFDDVVYVGYDANPQDQSHLAGDIRQEWAGSVGAKKRDEVFDIVCAIVVTRGDNESKLARDDAFDILGTVESTLRADPSLGFSPPFVAGVKPRQFLYTTFNDGVQGRLPFLINVKTRV